MWAAVETGRGSNSLNGAVNVYFSQVKAYYYEWVNVLWGLLTKKSNISPKFGLKDQDIFDVHFNQRT